MICDRQAGRVIELLQTEPAKAIAHAACRKLFSVGFWSFHKLFADMALADLHATGGGIVMPHSGE